MNGEKKIGDIVPYELTNKPITELIGNRQLTVEGCRSVEEYTDISIKIKTSEGIVCAFGTNLNIKLLSTSAIIVEGAINRVEFEDWR